MIHREGRKDRPGDHGRPHSAASYCYTLEEGFLKTIPRQDASLLEVDNINGNIHVSSWGKDSLRIDAVKKVRAGSREDAEGWMEDLEIRIERYDERIKVKTIYPHVGRRWGPLDFIFRRWTKGRVDYTISVPADFDLRLHTVNGGIKVGKIREDVEAEAVNGSVHMEEVEGSVRGRTVNGSVDVREKSEWPPLLEDRGRQRDVFKYSRVEGLALGLEITVQSDRDKAYLRGTYGFARKRWTYRFGGEKYLWRGLSLGADLHDIVDTQDSWIVPDPEATALMLIMGTAARDYFNRQGYGLGGGQGGKAQGRIFRRQVRKSEEGGPMEPLQP